MIDLPPLFLERMRGLFGADTAGYTALLDAYAQNSAAGLRVNLLKSNPADFLALTAGLFPGLIPLDFCPEAFLRLDGNAVPGAGAEYSVAAPGAHPYHQAGLYYLQDAAATAPVALLDPQPGERILDLAAAPGGKSTQIAARLQGRGLLVSNEIHPKRVWDLAENLERFGARNAVITNETPERLAAHFGAFFDRVLLDAPCSGEGMFRKSAAARQAWSPDLVAGCAVRQVEILRQAARLVRPGGRLVYVTCTLSPEENEGALAAFLQSPDGDGRPFSQTFHLLEPPASPAFAPGHPEWIAADLPDWVFDPMRADWAPAAAPDLHLERAVRLWPQRPADSAIPYANLGLAAGDGHFIAVLERAGGTDDTAVFALQEAETSRGRAKGSARPPKGSPKNAARPGPDPAFSEFLAETLTPAAADSLAAAPLQQVGQYIYKIPAANEAGQTLNLGGLRAIHPGWWLGELKKNRFEPSHALALGLTPAEARQVHALAPDSPQTAAYLRGETLPSPGPDGWVLVCLEPGFPLGWGKRSQGVLKNFYPKGLRR